MKKQYIKIFAGMSALFVSMSILPAQSVAQGVQLDLNNGRMRIQGPNDGYDRRDDRRYDRRDDRREERGPRCTPRAAVNAASRYIDDPRVRNATRQYYVVDGYGRSGGGRGKINSVRISTDDCSRVG